MLRDLHVRNLAVLEEARVEFVPGLNVLTGETGAGKSLVVDSLALLAGARASGDLIRKGADQLTVTGVFEPRGSAWRRELEAAGVEHEPTELVVRREISRAGRNRVFVNDQPVTLRLLSRLAPAILRIHTQREELSIIAPELQLDWLDRVGEEAIAKQVGRARERWERYREVANRLDRSRGDERLRLERIDLLRFQAGELDAARPQAGEEDELRLERDRLRHRETIDSALRGASDELFDRDGSAVDAVARSERLLAEIVDWEPEARDWRQELEEVRIRLDEVARSLRDRRDDVESDPGRLNAVEDRLAQLERLFRKYGDSSTELIELRERIAAELDDLDASDERRAELEQAAAAALEEYRRAATRLSGLRATAAERLAERIHGELADLAMGRARFRARLDRQPRPDSPLVVDGEPVEGGPRGIDRVVFELAANPGEGSAPLVRAASGGELSRVFLALQLAVQIDREQEPTLVFDEVDAGVGGAEAAALGRKLKRLGRSGQVLAVTHLPQVASFSDAHFKVEKSVRRSRTRIAVSPLDGSERVREVARMLAGEDVTELSLSHAEELIAVSAEGRG